MACKVIKNDAKEIVGIEAPNGKPSQLFNQLSEIAGTRLAYDIYSFIRTKEFTDWFGEKWDTPSDQPARQISEVKYYEGNITPEPNTVFVFGSNPLGINGNPKKYPNMSASVAVTQFGVKQGEKMINRLSDSGNAYGLVTVTGPGKKRSLTPKQIINNIQKLYTTAEENPSKNFKIAYRSGRNNNGYSNLELIEMFNQAGNIPSNVIFSKEWFDTGKLNIQPTQQASEVNLGTETAPKGGKVVISATKGKKPQPGAVVAFRTKGKTEQNMIDALEDNAVGNPFGPYAAIVVPATGVAVTRFLNWLEGTGDTNVMQKYRQALLAKAPELKGKTIYYYKDLGRPSHATALDYFLNKPTQQTGLERSIFKDENGEPKLLKTAKGFEWINKKGEYQLLTGPEFKDWRMAESLAINRALTVNSPRLEEELLDVISQIAIDAVADETNPLETAAQQREFLNSDPKNPKDKGILAKSVLALAFPEVNKTTEFLDRALDYYQAWKDSRGDITQAMMMATEDNVDFSSADEMEIFFEVYESWEDVIDKNGNVTPGYRSKIRDRLTYHGLQMQDGTAEVVETEEGPQKIYDKSTLAEDPRNKLSKEAKYAIQGIKDYSDSLLGLPRPIPIKEVYGYISAAAVGQKNMRGIKNKLRDIAPYNPRIVPVIQRLEELSPKQESAVFANFILAYKTFTLMEITQEVMVINGQMQFTNGKPEILTKTRTYNPNENETARAYRTQYKRNSRTGKEGGNERAIYSIDEEGKLTVIPEKLEEAEKALNKINKLSKGLTGRDQVPQDLSDALAEYMWALGMQYGPTLETTKVGLEAYFRVGRVVAGKQKVGFNLFTDFMSGNKKRLGTYLLNQVKKGIDIYDKEGSTIRKVAAISHLFDPKRVGSFISGTNKQFYPLNLGTTLDELARDYSSDQMQDKIAEMLEDPFYKPERISNRFTSALLLDLKDDGAYRREFELEYFDSLKMEGATDYEGLNEKQSLLVRLNKYINQGNKYFRAAVPTQADRAMLNFLPFKRYSQTSKPKADYIRSFVIQDYVRIAQGKRIIAEAKREGDTSKLIEGVHYGKVPFDGGGSINSKDLHQILRKSPKDEVGQREVIEKDPFIKDPLSGREDSIDSLSSLIDRYLDGSLEKVNPQQKLLVDEYINYQVETALQEIDEAGDDIEIRFAQLGLKKKELDNRKNVTALSKNFFRDFAFDEVVARIEMNKLFRGGLTFSKNLEDFYKRMKLISTPGNKLAIQGFSEKDPAYGMPPTYLEITIEDFDFINADDADAYAKEMYENLINAGVPAVRAKDISENYRANTGIEKGDAQGIISIHMYRHIQQGLGLWDDVLDEQAYRNELDTNPDNPYAGRYMDNEGNYRPIRPLKPYHEEMTSRNGMMTLSMNKNSYTTVTKEMALGMPIMQRALNAFNQGVDVVNPVSATKGAKIDPQNIYDGELDVSKAMVMDSTGLRFPQLIPMKKQTEILFSRQVRKNAIANIVANGVYKLGGQKIQGSMLKDLLHGLIATNIKTDTDKLHKELGLDRLYKATLGTEEYAKAKLKYLESVRDVLSTQIKDRNLGSNYSKALEIIADGKYDYKFRVPLSFPTYQSAFEQVYASIFKKNIFDQMIKGKELVQVAEMGGYMVDGQQKELKMYTGTGRAHVKIKRSILGIPSDMSIEEAKEKFPHKLEALGYRVPNQGKNSTLPIEVVGFLPDSHDKAIMVPGGITRQMGSDFDIDKMFIIQRELNEDGSKIKTSLPKVKSLEELDKFLESLSREERDAMLYDAMDAVITSPLHLEEVVSPLDNKTLPDLAKVLAKPEITNPLNPLVEITMENRNKTGQAMTGIWANFLSGRNVLEAKDKKVQVDSNYALKLFITDTTTGEKELKRSTDLGRTKDFKGRFTDLNISDYISVAVDASNNPIHVAINDNKFTSQAAGYIMSMGMPLEETASFVNMPTIVDATTSAKLVGGFNTKLLSGIKFLGNVYGKLGEIGEFAEAVLKDNPPSFTMDIELIKKDARTPMLSASEIIAKRNEGLDVEEDIDRIRREVEYTYNMYLYTQAGDELQKLNKLITPDTQENLNELSAIIAHIEAEEAFFNNENPIILEGKSFLRDTTTTDLEGKEIEGGVYRTSAAYRNIFQTMLNAAEAAGFVNNRPSFYTFKEMLKAELAIETLNAEQHKFIDRVLFLKMLANEGGPIGDLMSEDVFKAIFTNPNSNVETMLKKTMEEFPKFADNAFVKMLKPHPANDREGNAVFTLQMDNSYDLSTSEKDFLSQALLSLIVSPEEFANNPEDKTEINKIVGMGKAIVANQLLTLGTLPGAGGYLDILPVEFFSTRVLNATDNPIAISPVEDFQNQRVRTLSPMFFADFVQDFIRNFGTTKRNYKTFVPKTKSKPSTKRNQGYGNLHIPISKPESKSSYLYIEQGKEQRIFVATRVFPTPDGTKIKVYIPLQPLGVKNRAHEILTKRSSTRSLIPANVNINNHVISPAKILRTEEAEDRIDELGRGVMPESVEQPLKVCKIG